jgi:hypothetical protein
MKAPKIRNHKQMAAKVLADTTLRTYAYNLQCVKTIVGSEDINDSDRFVKAIVALDAKDNTKKTYFTALYHYTKIQAYRGQIGTLRQALNTVAMEQVKTPTEAERWKPWPELSAMGLKVLQDPTVPMEERILMGLYTQIPPARLDYQDVLVSKTSIAHPTGTCMIDLSTAICYIFQHKTAKSIGTIEHTLPDVLIDVLREYVGEAESRSLFVGLTPGTMGKRIKSMMLRHTGKDITMNLLRHSYITEMTKGAPFIDARVAIAKAMGHCVGTDELYRRR